MTENVVCTKCQRTFERVVIVEESVREVRLSTFTYIEEPDPVCNECEHEYLSWAGCPPLC
jgi:hypothetical protein